MKTRVTTDPQLAAELIKSGGVVAFPTETVYGLGADVFNERAVAKIFEAKRRPADNPLIAHVGDLAQIKEMVAEVPAAARKFIVAFFPGPLTLVLKKSVRIPLIATAGLETIGVRMPANDLARTFLKNCGTPVVAPSANLSGRPSPTTWQAVLEDLDGRIDCILQGEQMAIGLESTVVDCTSDVPLLLRPGAISLEELRGIVPETALPGAAAVGTPRSPGMKHKHYSPSARVRIFEPANNIAEPERSAFIGLGAPLAQFALARTCASVEEYARDLFEYFRECDRRSISTIYCESVREEGIGLALMDRIRRAADPST